MRKLKDYSMIGNQPPCEGGSGWKYVSHGGRLPCRGMPPAIQLARLIRAKKWAGAEVSVRCAVEEGWL